MIDKPKPIIQKIELSSEDKEDIQAIMEMRPTKIQIAKWEKGSNYRDWKHHYRPSSRINRMKLIQQKYFGGLCHVCRDFPLYKVTFKMDGINLVEYYCQKHLDKITT